MENKKRAIEFPKYLLIEKVRAAFRTSQEVYIRIHEKNELDHDDNSRLGVIYLEGRHEDDQGSQIKEMNSFNYLNEKITSLSYAIDQDCGDDLQHIILIIVQAYQTKYKLGQVSQKQWSDFKVTGNITLPQR